MTVPQNDPGWRKAKRSQNEGACVELHPAGAVRDSKNSDGPALRVDIAFLLATVTSGQLDRR